MCNELESFERLVSRAKQEAAPVIDVTAEVVAAVQKSRPPVETVDRAAIMFAAASVLAASIVALVAWQLIEEPMLAEVPNPFVVPVMVSQ